MYDKAASGDARMTPRLEEEQDLISPADMCIERARSSLPTVYDDEPEPTKVQRRPPTLTARLARRRRRLEERRKALWRGG